MGPVAALPGDREHPGMGRGWRIGLGVAVGFTVLGFWLGGVPAFIWIGFLVSVSLAALLYIWSDAVRHHQAKEAWGRVERRLLRTWLGRWMSARIGRPMARAELEKHLLAERRERAIALAQRFDLVAEGAECAAEHRGPEAAADFARACGHADVAAHWWRTAYETRRAAGDFVRAAEAAEAAGMYREAMAAWDRLPDGAGRLAQARLSEHTGHPREALDAFLDLGAAGDAIRVAERCGLLDELVAGAESRTNIDLWRAAADTCGKHGRAAKAVDLYRRAGDLRLALAAAKAGGLDAIVREIEAGFAARREADARDEARARGFLE